MYQVIITTSREEDLKQVRIGLYGSDKLPDTFCTDLSSLVDRCAPVYVHAKPGSNWGRRTEDGRFYRKCDAEACKNTIEKAALAGGMYLKGKTGADFYMPVIEIKKVA